MTQGLSKDTTARPSGLRFLWLAVAVVFVWSAIRPHDYFTCVGRLDLSCSQRALRADGMEAGMPALPGIASGMRYQK